MRERELDEFSSIFQRSIIPTIEVERIEIAEIVVLEDDALSGVAEQLARRFDAKVTKRYAADLDQVLEEKPSLIIAPALGEFTDNLLVATSVPTLLMRGPADTDVFHDILAKIPGGRHDLIEQFSFAFALCPPGGRIRLLHVVEEERLEEMAELLEATPEIDTEEGAAGLRAAIEARMEHLLRGAVKMARNEAFDVEAAIEVGDPFAIVSEQVRDFSLLIVGSHDSHDRFLESRAYELIRRVPDIPVLAL